MAVIQEVRYDKNRSFKFFKLQFLILGLKNNKNLESICASGSNALNIFISILRRLC